MNVRASFVLCFALVACNNASSREPADARDAAAETRDAAALDAARDGAQMQMDARTYGQDASSGAEDAGNEAAADAAVPVGSDSYVYIGGWGSGDYPVKTYLLDGKTGQLNELDTSKAFGVQPSFITANAAGTLLYMTNEDPSAPGITIATIDPHTGIPSKLDKRTDPGGGGFVHAAISPNGKNLLAADYGKGRLVDYPIAGDGKLGAALSTIAFGDQANTHSSAFHPSGRYAYSPNKGLDLIGQFSVDASNGALSQRTGLTTEGDGPRMIALAASGKYAYVMFENDSSLEAYQIGDDGLLARIDRENTLPPSFSDQNTGGHALLHPNGKFLYVSNRGADTIVTFSVADDGKLAQLAQTPSGGRTPRCFAIDAAGKWLVAANQADGSNGSLVTFAIGVDGKLSKTKSISGLQQPTAVAIVPKR
jgi:6-phosphogluconolactonase